MSNAITAYQETISEFSRVCSKLKNLVASVRVWADRLQNFNNVMLISDASEETQARIGNSNKEIFCVKDFPSQEHLHQAFAAFYQAKNSRRKAWDSLSQAEKIGLQPPEECV